DAGKLGEPNDVVCAGIEHKLGINGNPTCTMKFGEKGKGAVGYLVGEANRGLEYMFIMMNAARFSVGVQGYAVADRAYQSSLAYAKERVQMTDVASRSKESVRIIEHPDVRRMLMWQKANIEAMRALSYVTAASLDFAHKSPDEKTRKEHKAFVELMIPVVKGWCTENAIDLCSNALQIFGGMGYVEETGIAQQYRDVRITTIYEGTTGIQALDLVGRKLVRDMGATATAVMKRMEADAKAAAASENADVKAIGEALLKGIATLAEVSQWLGMNAMGDLRKAFACSVPYLKLWGVVAGGWQMARAAMVAAAKIAGGDKDPFYAAKITTSKFYASHVLSQGAWYKRQVIDGSGDVMTLPEEAYELDRKMAVTA
ncbi:MAG: acyl-CoA dehydrogenase, partial [bacterium]|nr:acyl-CoA dehydrogenase [bacterium]